MKFILSLVASLFCVAVATAQEATPFQEARPGYEYQFPRDFGSHDAFRVEWWYYTGNLKAVEDGRDFGYQLTFFRVGLDPEEKIPNPSRWTPRQIYFSHFTVTDVAGEKFYFFEKINRAGLGTAGAEAGRMQVWNDDWTLEGDASEHHFKARQNGVGLELKLKPSKPLVFHGAEGISRKGEEEGNASHYFSYTRMASEGVLELNGKTYRVEGTSWMDREFSSNQLNDALEGWDWFSLKLNNDYEVMLYQLRKKGGGVDAFSSGTLIAPDGSWEHLRLEQFTVKARDQWTSPETGAAYPSGWEIAIPDHKIQLRVEPDLRKQELYRLRSIDSSYWEGSVSVQGRQGGESVDGKGYVELVGYEKPLKQELPE
ncbi:MAG: carotenoid 1,2-hydratase [Candidatus Nitrohelix vancouverensis]|uniref:Carotenoid 1,2-hydratase n=1 Tax=Candidatus Nitrohelix vancouverensis TaxID=2705534 RepID=A0A7T0G3C0_9BACT|nr:MAG: carotenoid 1,2-hydratase [Candidatus Nitrohelix vancouverensis]